MLYYKKKKKPRAFDLRKVYIEEYVSYKKSISHFE